MPGPVAESGEVTRETLVAVLRARGFTGSSLKAPKAKMLEILYAATKQGRQKRERVKAAEGKGWEEAGVDRWRWGLMKSLVGQIGRMSEERFDTRFPGE